MTPPLTRTERGSGRLLALTHVILIGCSPVAVQVILALSPGLTTCRFGSSRICGGSAHKVAKFQMYGLYQSSDVVCVLLWFSSLRQPYHGTVPWECTITPQLWILLYTACPETNMCLLLGILQSIMPKEAALQCQTCRLVITLKKLQYLLEILQFWRWTHIIAPGKITTWFPRVRLEVGGKGFSYFKPTQYNNISFSLKTLKLNNFKLKF